MMKNKESYIIMSEDNEFILSDLYKNGTELHLKFTNKLNKAIIYDSFDKVKGTKFLLNNLSLCVREYCPSCNKYFEGYPAISRIDNRTHIKDDYVDDNALKIEIHKKINSIDSLEKLLNCSFFILFQDSVYILL